MKRVILIKGLPSSGKSTWAKTEMGSHLGMYKRVNKDDLRAMLDVSKWSPDNEKFVLQLRDHIIFSALKAGKHVIVDDCNLAPKHEIHIKELVKGKAEVEIKDFTDVDVEECIRRDLKRANNVGERVIRQMYNQFLKPKPEVRIYDPNLPDAIICDLDGTLALFGDKNPYDRDFSQDVLNDPVAKLVKYYKDSCQIIIVSGRTKEVEATTRSWLARYGLPYKYLFMRESGDKRKDVIIKKEIYDQHIKGEFNVLFVLDDRQQTVDGWRVLGLTCFQVAEGNF